MLNNLQELAKQVVEGKEVIPNSTWVVLDSIDDEMDKIIENC